MSTNRFPVTVDDCVVHKHAQFGYPGINPWPRPQRVTGDFGKFEVTLVEPELAHIRCHNPGKGVEFANVYTTTSYLFDATMHLMELIQLPAISHNVCRSLALVA